jgi:hypothetical protein
MELHGQAPTYPQAWSPKNIPTYAKASVGHPPPREIRRSIADSSPRWLLPKSRIPPRPWPWSPATGMNYPAARNGGGSAEKGSKTDRWVEKSTCLFTTILKISLYTFGVGIAASTAMALIFEIFSSTKACILAICSSFR